MGVCIVNDLIVKSRPRSLSAVRNGSNFHALDSIYREHRLSYPAVQFPVPVNIRTQTGRDSGGTHLEGAAHRVTVFDGLINDGDHLSFRFRVHTADRGILDLLSYSFVKNRYGLWFYFDSLDGDGMAEKLDAKRLQEQFADCAHCHTGSRFPCAAPLKNISNIAEIVFQRSSQV